jgi:hypothetical protein
MLYPSSDSGSHARSLKQRFQQAKPRSKVTPEQVLKSFNTRAFKRQQPDNPQLMLEIVANSLAHKTPVPFVLYWGKGPRPHLAEPELKCLDFVDSVVQRVRQVYDVGAKVNLIFTDTHAELNGHTPQSVRMYFEDLCGAAKDHCFEISLLSQLVNGSEMSEANARHETVPPDLLAKLRASAAKWFRGNGTVEDGAIRYYQLNLIEKRVVELYFPGSIFVTFNNSELRSLFPSGLPIFYMFSVRHGVSDKPWFLPEDFISRNTSNVHHLEVS